jgi:tetratricopeptide (TPR) repeat protein
MPSHIYTRTGVYHDASETNEAAIKSDRTFLQQSHEAGVYPVMYATHNIDFLCYDEMMEGRKRDAIKTARDLKAAVPLAILTQMPMLEIMWPEPYFAMARFGAWDEIIAEPAPPEQFNYINAMWHYARGLAFAATGKFDEADEEKKALDTDAASISSDLQTGPNNKARDVAKMASMILAGTIASDRGHHDEAIRDFTEAVREQDALGYNEPPSWYYPIRETLGAELLTDKKVGAAEKVYRDDLKKNPENPRSLYGLAQSLRAEGKADEAAKVQHRFTVAWSHADVTLAPTTVAAQ